MTQIIRWFFGLTALLAVFFPAQGIADPSARIGRISLLEGPSLFRIDRDDRGTRATLNWPLSSGAIIDTGKAGRVEIWIGSTAFRLAAESRLEFGLINDRQMILNLATGTLSLTLRDNEQADDIEVRTPHGRLKFASKGSYRIDVGTLYTNLSTLSGNAYIPAGEQPIVIGPLRMASLERSGMLASYGDLRHDHFDDWTALRDAATRVPPANQFVSSEMTGHHDLEQHGEWSVEPEYGNIWHPHTIPVGWAPYSTGRWAWIQPWGWTWIDAAPWGFAPFHFGRWLEVRGRWAWVPGSYAARPVYAPALVAWVGNPGWNAHFSHGKAPAVGWFPLAPREVFIPSYRASNHYVYRINITHVSDSDSKAIERAVAEPGERRFTHRHSTRAITVVPADTLREGRPIHGTSLPGGSLTSLRQAMISSQAPAANRAASNNGIAEEAAAAPTGIAHSINKSMRPSTAQDNTASPPAHHSRETVHFGTETRGERPRIDSAPLPPDAVQRPLPPGIKRLPSMSHIP